MKYIPDHWKRILEKFVDRGWLDPDTYEPIEETHINIKERIGPVPLPKESVFYLEPLRKTILRLALDDKNHILASTYFKMASRGSRGFFDPPGGEEEKLFRLGTTSGGLERPDVSKLLPIEEPKYIEMAIFLGSLTIADYNQREKYNDYYSEIFGQAFLHLQKRAREANGFELNKELDDLEQNISQMMEEQKENIKGA